MSSAEYELRRLWSRATSTPPAATPATPANPIHFQMLRMDKVCLSCAGEREHGVATRALDETRTGDIWLFRGGSGPDRAIQSMTNSPVNHVGMTVAIDDLPPLIWHAELGDKLTDMWTGSNHRGVQLNDARQAVGRWIHNYGQRCWLRQLTPYATREQEDRLLRVIARMDGTPFPSTARLTAAGFEAGFPRPVIGHGESPSWTGRFANPQSARRRRNSRWAWKPPIVRRRSPSPTRRWGCSQPRSTTTGLTQARSGAVTNFRCARLSARRRDRRPGGLVAGMVSA